MTYNPLFPKPSSFFQSEESIATPLTTDAPVATRIHSWNSFGYFYGTDINGEREGYGSSIRRALTNRVVTPIREGWDNPRGYFFKPYRSPMDIFNTAMAGPVTAGLLTSALIFGSPFLMLLFICLPAVIELVTCITSIVQSLFHATKSLCTDRTNERAKANEYLLDATTRLALVIPLALLCVAAVPFETVRFFTRFFGKATPAERNTAPIAHHLRVPPVTTTTRFPGRGHTLGSGRVTAAAPEAGAPPTVHSTAYRRVPEVRRSTASGAGPRRNIHGLRS